MDHDESALTQAAAKFDPNFKILTKCKDSVLGMFADPRYMQIHCQPKLAAAAPFVLVVAQLGALEPRELTELKQRHGACSCFEDTKANKIEGVQRLLEIIKSSQIPLAINSCDLQDVVGVARTLSDVFVCEPQSVIVRDAGVTVQFVWISKATFQRIVDGPCWLARHPTNQQLLLEEHKSGIFVLELAADTRVLVGALLKQGRALLGTHANIGLSRSKNNIRLVFGTWEQGL
jgi:hypothetical protein